MNKILRETSLEVFRELGKQEYRILKILAKFGNLNQKEIGHHASYNYTETPLERWAVKKILEGSYQYIGLIPNEFVYHFEKNKKEKQYGLTLKGILAVLAFVEFEEIKSVQLFQKFLRNYKHDKRMTKWAFEFIKYEISLILFYNYTRGIEMTRFKGIRYYWHKFKNYDHDIIESFFVNYFWFMEKKQLKIYDSIKEKYLTLFFILDGCTREISIDETRNWHDYQFEFQDDFREHVDKWYLYVDMFRIKESLVRKDWKREDLIPYYDEKLWNMERKEPHKKAYKILKKFDYIK